MVVILGPISLVIVAISEYRMRWPTCKAWIIPCQRRGRAGQSTTLVTRPNLQAPIFNL